MECNHRKEEIQSYKHGGDENQWLTELKKFKSFLIQACVQLLIKQLRLWRLCYCLEFLLIGELTSIHNIKEKLISGTRLNFFCYLSQKKYTS